MPHAQAIPPSTTSPTIILHNSRPATTSLEVAKFFGKQHAHVLRSIKELTANSPESFAASNFGASEYTDETGRILPQFILSRDGFMLLVMGYTGKKAMQIKIAYIEAFNLMEKELAEQKALPPAAADAPDVAHAALPRSTVDDRKPIRSLVSAWAIRAGVEPVALWPQIRAHFKLRRMEELPAERINEVLEWIQTRINALPKSDARDPLGDCPIPPSKPASRTSVTHVLASRNFSEDWRGNADLIGLTREEKFERIAQRIEKVRTRTAEEVRRLCWDLFLLLRVDSQRCSPFLTRSVTQILLDNIMLQITAPVPMGDTTEHNPVLLVRELNKALQD